jgi:autotransporter-associated beta strand protein
MPTDHRVTSTGEPMTAAHFTTTSPAQRVRPHRPAPANRNPRVAIARRSTAALLALATAASAQTATLTYTIRPTSPTVVDQGTPIQFDLFIRSDNPAGSQLFADDFAVYAGPGDGSAGVFSGGSGLFNANVTVDVLSSPGQALFSGFYPTTPLVGFASGIGNDIGMPYGRLTLDTANGTAGVFGITIRDITAVGTGVGYTGAAVNSSYIVTTAAPRTFTWTGAPGGTWNAADANWTSIRGPVWLNRTATPDVAVFNNAGAVNVAGGINAGQVQFAGSTTLSGGSLNLLPYNNVGPSIDTAGGAVATVTTSLGGSAGLTKTGAGTLVLAGGNTFTGGLNVRGGTVAVDGFQAINRLTPNTRVTVSDGGTFEVRGINALPYLAQSVDVSVESGGTLRLVSGASAASTVSHTHLRNVTLGGGSVVLDYSGSGSAYDGSSVKLNGDITSSGTSSIAFGTANTLTGGIGLNGARTFNVTGGTLTVSAEIQNDVDSAAGRLVKAGAGTLVLTGVNSYTGGTSVNAGTLQIGDGTSAGSVAGDISNGAAVAFNTPAAGQTFGGVISGGGSVIKAGPGTLTLTGQHTFTGGTVVQAGTLVLGDGSNAAGLVGLTPPFDLFAGGQSGTRAITVEAAATARFRPLAQVTGGAGTSVIASSGSGAPAVVVRGGSVENAGQLVGGAGAENGYIDGTRGGDGVFVQTGGSVDNAGSIAGGAGGNTYGVSRNGGDGGDGVRFAAGGSLANRGTIAAGVGGRSLDMLAGSPGSPGVGVRFDAAGSLANLRGGVISGGVRMASVANVVTLGVGSRVNGPLNIGTHAGSTLTLTDDGLGGTQAYSAAVTGTTTFDGTLVKSGGGTWIIDATLSHHGGTRVDVGELRLTPTARPGYGTVTVNAGGTLSGDGGTDAAVVVRGGGTLAPTAAGTLAAGTLTLGDAAAARAVLRTTVDFSANTAGVIRAADVTLDGAELRLDIAGAAPAGPTSKTFILVDHTGTGSVVGTFAAVNPPQRPQWLEFSIDYAYTGPALNGVGDGNDIAVTFQYVPEPSSIALLAPAAALLSRRRRRLAR